MKKSISNREKLKKEAYREFVKFMREEGYLYEYDRNPVMSHKDRRFQKEVLEWYSGEFDVENKASLVWDIVGNYNNIVTWKKINDNLLIFSFYGLEMAKKQGTEDHGFVYYNNERYLDCCFTIDEANNKVVIIEEKNRFEPITITYKDFIEKTPVLTFEECKKFGLIEESLANLDYEHYKY